MLGPSSTRNSTRATASVATIASTLVGAMSELQDVLRAIQEGAARGDRMALATIVQVKGSTYRREGARLLVPEHGKPVGTISGGCLEGDVREAAVHVMAEGRPRLLHFDLTADDEIVWGWGLGCNGGIDVFVEPAEGAMATAEALRADARGTGAGGAVAGARCPVTGLCGRGLSVLQGAGRASELPA